jgi:hypothetical protein
MLQRLTINNLKKNKKGIRMQDNIPEVKFPEPKENKSEQYNRKSKRTLKHLPTNSQRKEIEILRQPNPDCRNCKGTGKAGYTKNKEVVICFCVTKKFNTEQKETIPTLTELMTVVPNLKE